MRKSELCIILTTIPDRKTADYMARILVKEMALAACVSILPPMQSVYRWEGRVETADEYQLIIKTTDAVEADIYQVIRAHHPYDVPEIITLNVENSLDSYLDWVTSEVET